MVQWLNSQKRWSHLNCYVQSFVNPDKKPRKRLEPIKKLFNLTAWVPRGQRSVRYPTTSEGWTFLSVKNSIDLKNYGILAQKGSISEQVPIADHRLPSGARSNLQLQILKLLSLAVSCHSAGVPLLLRSRLVSFLTIGVDSRFSKSECAMEIYCHLNDSHLCLESAAMVRKSETTVDR